MGQQGAGFMFPQLKFMVIASDQNKTREVSKGRLSYEVDQEAWGLYGMKVSQNKCFLVLLFNKGCVF